MDRLEIEPEVELAYIDRGTGPVVLLVHGFPFDHTMWNAQVDALAETHRVLAVDLRGFGASSVTKGTVTMDRFADDLARFLDVLKVDEPIRLGGLSMGGYVALAFARRHARRLARLILFDTRAAADPPEVAAKRLATAESVLNDGAEKMVDAMIPVLFARKSLEQKRDLIDAVRRTMLATDPHGIAAAARGMAKRPDSTSLLPSITVPTLVLVGLEDRPSPPEEMRQIAEAIPNGHMVEIPEAGHLTPLEQPERVNQELTTFLRQRS